MPVCRWCDNPVIEIDLDDRVGRHWVHDPVRSRFALYCPRCQRTTHADSSQADCCHCNYLLGDNHLAEPRT